jgi:predicted ABC-type ATPase
VALGAEDTGKYPGKLGIDKNKNLSPEQREVEARFAAYLEANTDEAIRLYIEKFGNEINADNVRELSLDYAPGGIDALDPATVAARTRWGEAVHEPASALTREIYRRALRKVPPADRRKQVIFTAGGPGAGKTTSIRNLPDLSRAIEATEIVYDTTLSTFVSALERIKQALDAGRMVSIIFIYRDPIDSLVEGVLPRARMMGRTVPLEIIVNIHLRVPEAILRIAELFKNDPRVALAIIDNRDGSEDATMADLAFVERMGRKYTRETLQAALLSALEEAYEKGRRGDKNGISESIYRSIKGNAP